ncbi:hypothetical protein BDB00DRAFT_847351 [Zychaea mexicana]|uniref:uncharacterized protein n=1 Tax=Zychaea mexicana TaxID=64656 RepID=UPI0022FE2F07|nr:uncharacterized protein BDB00DRAFT_847351 [Zychaea mexicana]KAI9488668.1 hypothetical protein BDB00DRAFT_847351 [Zychaea mexicana]
MSHMSESSKSSKSHKSKSRKSKSRKTSSKSIPSSMTMPTITIPSMTMPTFTIPSMTMPSKNQCGLAAFRTVVALIFLLVNFALAFIVRFAVYHPLWACFISAMVIIFTVPGYENARYDVIFVAKIAVLLACTVVLFVTFVLWKLVNHFHPLPPITFSLKSVLPYLCPDSSPRPFPPPPRSDDDQELGAATERV